MCYSFYDTLILELQVVDTKLVPVSATLADQYTTLPNSCAVGTQTY